MSGSSRGATVRDGADAVAPHVRHPGLRLAGEVPNTSCQQCGTNPADAGLSVLRCGSCLTACYCARHRRLLARSPSQSKQCQRQDWKDHKIDCARQRDRLSSLPKREIALTRELDEWLMFHHHAISLAALGSDRVTSLRVGAVRATLTLAATTSSPFSCTYDVAMTPARSRRRSRSRTPVQCRTPRCSPRSRRAGTAALTMPH